MYCNLIFILKKQNKIRRIPFYSDLPSFCIQNSYIHYVCLAFTRYNRSILLKKADSYLIYIFSNFLETTKLSINAAVTTQRQIIVHHVGTLISSRTRKKIVIAINMLPVSCCWVRFFSSLIFLILPPNDIPHTSLYFVSYNDKT